AGLAGPIAGRVPPATVDAVEAVRLDRGDDAPNMTGRERDVIRVASHDAHEPAVGGHGHRVTRKQRAPAFGSGRPVQRSAPFEMAPPLDQSEAGEGLDDTLPVLDGRVGSHHPLAIRGRDVDRRVAEGATPLHADAVEVRVRHRDAVDAAPRADGGNALVIDESEAVPEEVAGRRPDEQRALADADRRIGANPGQTRLEFTQLDAVAFAAERGQRNPALPTGRNILPLVVADRAMWRRDLAFRLLHAARAADVRLHRL